MTTITVCNSNKKARMTVDNFWFSEVVHVSTTGKITMDQVYYHNDGYKVIE